MKKVVLLFSFLLSACVLIPPTPNDFPPPPTMEVMPPPVTMIVEIPNVTLVPALELRSQMITQEKMSDARTFFLILYTHAASGDRYGIAERVKYPLTVNINGPLLISSVDEFTANYDQIFNNRVMDMLKNTSEDDLILLPEGVRAGQGELWFNLFCVDEACSDTQFLITQINN
jgi:hypothetical protein